MKLLVDWPRWALIITIALVAITVKLAVLAGLIWFCYTVFMWVSG